MHHRRDWTLIPRSRRAIYVGRSNTCGSKRIILYERDVSKGAHSWHAAATARKFHEGSLKSCKSVSRATPPSTDEHARHDSVTALGMPPGRSWETGSAGPGK